MTKEYPKEKTVKQKWKKNPHRLNRENSFMKKWRKECEYKKILVQCMICDKDIVILEKQEAICDKCRDKIEEYLSANAVRKLREQKWNKAMELANGNFQKACNIYDDID